MTTHSRPRAGRFLVAVGAVLLASVTTGLLVSTASAGGSNALDVRATGSTCELSGAPKTGWTQLTFANTAPGNQAMAMVQLKKGVTAAQVLAAVTATDETEFAMIAANADTISGLPELLGPGQKTTTVTQLKAGHYGVICLAPTAADAHTDISPGMVKVVDISNAKSSLKPPTGRVVAVTLTDTEIMVPAGSTGRLITAKVTNKGTTPHTFTLVKVNDGKTLDDVKAYFDAFFSTGPPAGSPPGAIVGGISDISPGGTAYLVQSLTPGRYGYVSTDGDAPNDDYTKGMHGEFEVN